VDREVVVDWEQCVPVQNRLKTTALERTHNQHPLYPDMIRPALKKELEDPASI